MTAVLPGGFRDIDIDVGEQGTDPGSCIESPEDLLLHPARGSRSGCHMSSQMYLTIAAGVAALGGLLFGYDVGIISGALLQLTDEFNLSCLQQELVVSTMLLGALCASFCGGFLVDFFGRRRSIIVNAVIFIVGAVILAAAPNFILLVVGRLLVGFGVSLSAIAECVYISEIAPSKRRGLLVSLNELGITLGFLLAYLINYIFIHLHNGWRYMFALSAIPAIVQGVVMIFLPSSPRYLVIKGKTTEARMSLHKLRGTASVEVELDAIRSAVAAQKDSTFAELFLSKDHMSTRMLIAAGLVFFQQMTGQPTVVYYAPTIFQSIGFTSDSSATLATVGIGAVKVIFTVITLLCIDQWGRRKFLLCGTILMCISVAALGFIALQWPATDLNNPCRLLLTNTTFSTSHTEGSAISSNQLHTLRSDTDFAVFSNSTAAHLTHNVSSVSKWLAFTFLLLFIAGYSISFGPVTWLLLSEIFPTTLKGRAFSIATIMNWASNLVIAFTFLDVMKYLGVGVMFIIYSAITLISVLFVFVTVPETKGRSLENISAALKHGRNMKVVLQSLLQCNLFQRNPLTTTINVDHRFRPVRNSNSNNYRPIRTSQNHLLQEDSDSWLEESELSNINSTTI